MNALGNLKIGKKLGLGFAIGAPSYRDVGHCLACANLKGERKHR